MARVQNPNASYSWYYYYYHYPAVAARQTSILTPAHRGRALNPSAQPFDPKKQNPKPPSSPSIKLVPPFLPHHLIPPSRVYFSPLPAYQPLLHHPSVHPHAPPPLRRPPVQRTQEVGSLQGYGGKRATFAPRKPTKNKRGIWRPKVGTCSNSSAAVPVTDLAHGGTGDDLAEGATTLMIRNIPNSMKREDLMKILDEHCYVENKKLSQNQQSGGSCRSEYDFVYLPIDYRTKGNKGYAFVNFTSVDGAKRMWRAYHLFKWETASYPSPKICNICPAIVQGKDALLMSLQRRAFPREEYHPLMAESSARDGFNDAHFIAVGFGVKISHSN